MYMNYYYYRRVIPILFFVFYLGFKHDNSEKMKWTYIFLTSIMIFMIWFCFVGIYNRISFYNVFKMNWNYAGLVENMIFGIIIMNLSFVKTKDYVFSMNIMIQCISCLGWLYEISFFHSIEMFMNKFYPFFINTQILSILFLIYSLKQKEIKINKYTIIFFIIYIVFSIHLFKTYPHWISSVFPTYYIYYPSLIYHAKWYIRIPTMLLLSSIVNCLVKK